MKILLPFSWIYGGVMAFRNWLFNHSILQQKSFNLPIISIGNLSLGGTGKTPHTEYVLRQLLKENRSCAMLSRGYGRKTKGFYAAKGQTPQIVGDEPWQVQRKFPSVDVYVCEDRVKGVESILQVKRIDAIVLDDAFQHRYIKPGLSILLTDYSRPYFKDFVVPAGRLREFRKGAKRADLIIVTKCPKSLSQEEQSSYVQHLTPLPHQQVFFTSFEYGHLYPFACEEKEETITQKEERILLLCGIAKPQDLINYLHSHYEHIEVAKFADHHNFTPTEIDQICKRAKLFDKVITTEKDAARLSGYQLPHDFMQQLWVQPIQIKFINNTSNTFNKIISDYVTENSRNSKVD